MRIKTLIIKLDHEGWNLDPACTCKGLCECADFFFSSPTWKTHYMYTVKALPSNSLEMLHHHRRWHKDWKVHLKWGQLSVSLEIRTGTRLDKDRLPSASCLMPDRAYGSPGRGPPSLSFRAVRATTVQLTFPYWSPSDRAQLRPAIEPLMINSQILLCPQKGKRTKHKH